jgi:hypothetical protein
MGLGGQQTSEREQKFPPPAGSWTELYNSQAFCAIQAFNITPHFNNTQRPKYYIPIQQQALWIWTDGSNSLPPPHANPLGSPIILQ